MQERKAEKIDAVRQKPPIPRGILRRWLEQDGAPEQPWLNQRLIGAAKEGSERILLHFLKKGADVNAKDDVGRAALTYAAWHNHTQFCSILIEKGADVNLADNIGMTPLMYAAREGYTDVCMLLVEKGADLNQKDELFPKRTSFMWARLMERKETAAFLILVVLIGKDNTKSFESDFRECISGGV
jgi:ankyrin repeat protein